MNYLKELAHIVTKSRLRKIQLLEILPEENCADNAYTKLYLALQKGKNTPERDIIKELGWDESSSNYRMFKSRFLKRLLNSLLFLDPGRKDKNAYRVQYYNCLRNQFSINVLLFFSARNAAMLIARKTLQVSKILELTEISAFCARILRNNAALQGHLKDFEEFGRQQYYYTKVLAAEDKAREEYERINIHYATSTSVKPEFAPQAFLSAQKIKRLRLKYQTYQLYIYYYRLQGLANYISRDYKGALLVWDRFEKYIRSRIGFESQMRLAEAALNRMACYLYLRDFTEGKKCADECRNLIEAGTANWFYFMEYYFLLSMHSAEYHHASEILHEVTSHPRFQSLSEIRKEKWQIFSAYCFLAVSANSTGDAKSFNFEGFRLGKFLNETPLYAKDKTGYNIAILIIQFIYTLKKQDYLELINRSAALKQYTARHLKKETTLRAMIFIRMLLSIIDLNFETAKIRAKSQKSLAHLAQEPIFFSGNIDGMEVLAFETLWQKVLQVLETNSLKRK